MGTTGQAAKGWQHAQASGQGLLKTFGPAWVVLTSLGYAVGLGLAEALYRLLGTTLSGVAAGVGNVALYGGIVAGVIGSLQALWLRRRIERPYLWAVLSVAGGALGFALGTVAGEWAGNAIGLHFGIYLAGLLIEGLFGAFFGAGLGVAQWLLIRRQIRNASAWVPGSILGLTLGSILPGLIWLSVGTPLRALLGSSAPGLIPLTQLPFLGIWLGAGAGLALGLTQVTWARRMGATAAPAPDEK
jgi:hypothetical protein